MAWEVVSLAGKLARPNKRDERIKYHVPFWMVYLVDCFRFVQCNLTISMPFYMHNV
jgi:hypothetical protein